MKVLLVSGIWPPDVGGPATHAPEVAEGLRARGHDVEVVTTAALAPAPSQYAVRWVSRALPPGVRHAAVAALVAARSRRVDVVYAVSMIGRSSFAARAPLVVKVSGDPAYERSLRRGLYEGDLASFQGAALRPAAGLLRRWRTVTARRARTLLCPSEFLRQIVIGWGIPPDRVGVLPNPTPPLPPLPPRDELRSSFDVDGPVLAFAGRLTRAKALGVLRDAVDRVDGVTLLAAGEGEDAALLESARIRRLGALPRQRVLELFAAADAAVLSSAWENFPHVLVEALAVGTPVIATRVGGVPEIVEDGVNGLLVPPNEPESLAGAISRFFADADLRARLSAAAAPSVRRFAPEAVLDTLEAALARAVRPYSCAP
jgi:glycosyltransferase involved in cell wall biosynthesis